MTLAFLHDPAPIAGPGSAIMEGFLRRNRTADLCLMIAGCNARIDRLHNLGRDMNDAEHAVYDKAERDREAMRAELAGIVRTRLGVTFDELREAGL